MKFIRNCASGFLTIRARFEITPHKPHMECRTAKKHCDLQFIMQSRTPIQPAGWHHMCCPCWQCPNLTDEFLRGGRQQVLSPPGWARSLRTQLPARRKNQHHLHRRRLWSCVMYATVIAVSFEMSCDGRCRCQSRRLRQHLLRSSCRPVLCDIT